MTWYYMSFANPNLPKGSQFLGALIIDGYNPSHAISRSWLLKLNPGGEIAFAQLDEDFSPDTCAPELKKYIRTFVPREIVMAEGDPWPNSIGSSS